MRTVGILFAAGASRRFGSADKLLADWRGEPLVLAAARTLASAGCDAVAAIVSSDAVATVLPPEFRICWIAPGQPLSETWKRARNLVVEIGADRALIVLGDMPAIRRETLRHLLNVRDGSHACLVGDVRMPPALLTSQDMAGFDGHRGDFGARALLAELPPDALYPISLHEAQDIDFPEGLQSDGLQEPDLRDQ